jgi:maltose alpha-D-glucosyltransferase/alpha-amylase
MMTAVITKMKPVTSIRMQTPWWMTARIYEVYVDKFSGTFAGMIGHLDYLEKLGINSIWILPHYPSPMIDDGYDVSDYRAVRPELGTLDDFDTFTKAAHARGMRIIVDLVLNHTSMEHPWFVNACQSKDSPYRNYYLWSDTGTELASAINPMAHLKPSNWIFDSATGQYYFASFYPQQPDLNWANPEVEREMFAVADFWLERGVDGFRLDAVPFLWKREGTTCTNLPETHAILRRLREHLRKINPEAVLLAEANGTSTEVREYFGSGDECHLVFNFPLMLQTFLSLARGDLKPPYDLAIEMGNLPPDCQWATFLTNHDSIDFISASETDRETLMSFLDPTGTCLTNNETAIARRLASIFADPSRIIEAFKLLFSLPGVPVIYYGEEIGMKNASIHPLPVDRRRYVRGSFDWYLARSQMQDPDSIFNEISRFLTKL